LFLFKVAIELGMTVEEVVNKMSVIELAGWQVYFKFINDAQKE